MEQRALDRGAGGVPGLRRLLGDRRYPAMLGLGFSSGMPFLLVYATQSAWLSEAKVPLSIIGLLSEMTLAYKFKFVWAPFLDRYDVPGLARLVGRRRAWIIVSQLAVMAGLAGVAFGDPAHWLGWTIGFSIALGIAGATQDTVIDGWRIAAVPTAAQAVLTSWAEVGFRVGNLAAGAGALLLADRIGWRGAYLCMVGLTLPGVLAALLAPEPDADRAVTGGVGDAAAPQTATETAPGLVATVVAPIRELAGRLGPAAVPVLLLVAGFRMPGYVSSAMAIPLFKHLHYSNTDIATVTKLLGFWVALGGTFVAGFMVPRLGMMASLLVGTVTASASHLSLAYLAAHGDRTGGDFWLFAVTVGIDSFAYAFASIILITYMSSLTATAMAASQFALFTSLCAFPGSLLAGASGFIIERLGFVEYFVATSLIGVPVALLCCYVWHLHVRGTLGEAV